ncbi:MAG: magnesium/cobalt transporter CorA [SAR324 cluster bacterium]|nr:magnesium/cobalt transporter CorA [SAR324 cluster bacterium]
MSQHQITLMAYSQNDLIEKELPELGFPMGENWNVAWLNVSNLLEGSVLSQMQQLFEVHPLLREDILNLRGRPRISEFDNYLLIILKSLSYDSEQQKVIKEQISLIVGSNFVLSLQEQYSGIFDGVRKSLRSPKNRLRKMGPDYLAYELIDAVVRNYILTFNKFGHRIEDLEPLILENPTPENLQTIYHLSRQMTSIQATLLSMREITRTLQKGHIEQIDDSNLIYFRDLYEHLARAVDLVTTYQDMLKSARNAFHSSISNHLNHVMKVLTIISAVFMPPTLITSLYGMNFDEIPELRFHWGYPATLVVIMVLVGIMLYFFRKKGLL